MSKTFSSSDSDKSSLDKPQRKTRVKATAKVAAPLDPLAPKAAAFSKLELWASALHRDEGMQPQVVYVETAFVEAALAFIGNDLRYAGAVVEVMPIQVLATPQALAIALTPLEHTIRDGVWVPPKVGKAAADDEAPVEAKAESFPDTLISGVSEVLDDVLDTVTLAGLGLASAGIGKLRQGVKYLNKSLEERH